MSEPAKTHKLKVTADQFDAISKKQKTFEFRFNSFRAGYKVGDLIRYNYLDNFLYRKITYIELYPMLSHIKKYAVMSITDDLTGVILPGE